MTFRRMFGQRGIYRDIEREFAADEGGKLLAEDLSKLGADKFSCELGADAHKE